MMDAIYPVKTLVSLGQFGERARPLRYPLREAALIIGLGSLGLHALAQTRAMLTTMLPARDIKTHVRLMAIARKRSIREDTLLPREERLMLQLEPFVWSKVPGEYAAMNVAGWWPHSPRAPEFLDDPSRARVYSRLMLFANAGLISETLYRLAQWLFETGTGREVALARRVYILASLAEPEASGMVFDIASRLRALCAARAQSPEMPQPTITGIFTLRAAPDPRDPERSLAMAHVYAALREIDSYCLHPETYRSELPVVGHVLPQIEHPAPPLDMILMTGDTADHSPETPESALAECVATWIAASATPPDQPPTLPQPIVHAPGTDHFRGYTTFGFSKLALPTRAAMDLAAVGLALGALRAAKQTHPGSPTTEWTGPLLDQIGSAVLHTDPAHTPELDSVLQEWAYNFSGAGLLRKQEARQARGEPGGMLDLVQAEWRRLEREMVGADALVQGEVSTVPNTLRSRVDTLLVQQLRDVAQVLDNSPLDLAYGKGYGLVWTVSALEELTRLLREQLSTLGRARGDADAGRQMARTALFDAARAYDERSGGRRKPPVDALVVAAERALQAILALITAEARLTAWQALCDRAKQYTTMVRDVIPHVDQAVQALHHFEDVCRGQMEAAAHQPPQFPAGVALTEQWFAAGTQDLNTLRQSSPRDLLSRLYQAWGRPDDVPPNRQLSRFLFESRIAARRVLSSTFSFEDIYAFLEQPSGQPLYRQAMPELLKSATPTLRPAEVTHHPQAQPYEIVREVARDYSLVPPTPQPNVIRSRVPSPDQDEIAVFRLLHGVVAETLPAVADQYRRAYDQALAEGVPLHIDRRWDATMADLVHTDIRREVSAIWDRLISTITYSPQDVNGPLNALVHALKTAINANDVHYALNVPHDLNLAVYRLRPFRLKVPPPTCLVLFAYSTRPAEDVADSIVQAVRPIPVEEQFVFIVNVNGRPDIDLIVEPLRRLNYMVIVLSEADIKHLIGARMPMRALRDLVLSKVRLTNVSPFFIRGPVPEHMFFGREREIAEARSKLRTHSVALIGGRRIGKTSTLHRIQQMLLPRESQYVPYYLDCHNARDYQTLFWLINRRWAIEIPDTPNPVFFEDVITELQSRHTGQSIAVLLDEVDSLLNFDQNEAIGNHEILFRTFRSLSNERRCQFIFSGEKWLMAAITNPYSALFNFTQAVRLKPLPQGVVHHLVAEPFEMLNVWMEEADAIIERIYQISAGHPNIVQMICQGMVEELDHAGPNSNLISMRHLEDATTKRSLQEQIVLTIWGQMDELARLITLIWPEGTRMLSMREIEERLAALDLPPIDPAVLQQTAQDLELYCFVRPREHDHLELIPMAFPAILDFMTDKQRQIHMVRQQYLDKYAPQAGRPR